VVAWIAALLVNENVRQNEELATRINKSRAVVDFALNLMEANGHIKVSKSLGGQSLRKGCFSISTQGLEPPSVAIPASGPVSLARRPFRSLPRHPGRRTGPGKVRRF
jgi:hypothetical protein